LKATHSLTNTQQILSVKSLSVSGNLGIALDQFLQQSLVGGLSIYLLDEPKLQVTLGGVGEFVQKFGLQETVQGVIGNILSKKMVSPNRIPLPLALLQSDFSLALLKHPIPFGVLRIRFEGLQGHQFAEIQLGSKTWRGSPGTGMLPVIVSETHARIHIKIVQNQTAYLGLKEVEVTNATFDPLIVADVLQGLEGWKDLRTPAKGKRVLQKEGVDSLSATFQWMPAELGSEGKPEGPGILAVQIERIKLPSWHSGQKVKLRIKMGDGIVEETDFARTGESQLVDPIFAQVAFNLLTKKESPDAIAEITGLSKDTTELLTEQAEDGVDFATIAYIPTHILTWSTKIRAVIEIVSDSKIKNIICAHTLDLRQPLPTLHVTKSNVVKMPAPKRKNIGQQRDGLMGWMGGPPVYAWVSYAFIRTPAPAVSPYSAFRP